MNRLTINLSENRYRALKEASARRNKTIGQLIDESLEFYGIKTEGDALQLVRRARENSALAADEAMTLALRETRAARKS
ncbi:MAG TPA: hypothetical protein VFJ15_07050 [Oleiagrimonas sp.]|nr:hypothetical protein [Oleiagrimonas sp.]